MRCAKAERLIDELFLRDAPKPRPASGLWTHLGRCPGCRGRYDRVMLLDRLTIPGGGANDPSARELDVVAAVVEARHSEVAAPSWFPLEALVRSLQPLAWAAVMSLVLVVGVLVWRQQGEHFAARDGIRESLAVRAFCVTEDVRGETIVRSISSDPSPQEVAACPATGRLRFAYLSDAPGFLLAVEVRADGHVRWRLPPSADQSPPRIDVATRLTALPLELGPSDLRGIDTVELLFVRSDQPPPPSLVERLSRRAGAASLDEWGELGVAVRYRIRIEGTGP